MISIYLIPQGLAIIKLTPYYVFYYDNFNKISKKNINPELICFSILF
ncbi:hypothetical protein FVB9532_03654 [Mesonia oceanica]|uniref:Uncharacterized protein n=1 Tax=Mesonia oceanica TaxID=2687242 RepID=A0AC61YDM6_9FLAO|nr:hypothetical protein FVB9532_03654 [Mesonia oceanica]